MTTFMSVSARGVLHVVEVEHRLAVDDADRDRRDRAGSAFESPKRSSARLAAIQAPVIEAQRVPPSAWRTSQSSHSVRSPSASKSQTARSARPISRWISTVRPSGRPRETARCVRSPVEAGSIEYSAVIQPRPFPYSQRGTPSSIVAVQRTSVFPWP